MPGPPQCGGRADAAIDADGERHPYPLADQMAFLKSHLPKRKSRFH